MTPSKIERAEGGVVRVVVLDDLTPAELALLFCDMDGEAQAEFFSSVGKIAAEWPGAGWCQQSCAISENLDKTATETILKLAEWAAEPYVRPQPEPQGYDDRPEWEMRTGFREEDFA